MSNNEIIVKYSELSGLKVSYTTLKKQYDNISRIPTTTSKPITTSNRFDSLAEQTDPIEITNIIENFPSIIKNLEF